MSLTLDPVDALSFTLSRGEQTPRSVMTLTNSTQENIAFKGKGGVHPSGLFVRFFVPKTGGTVPPPLA